MRGTLENNIEAILFYTGEPCTRARLATMLAVSEEEIDNAGGQLAAALALRGVRLLHVNDTYELVTAPETTDAIASLRTETLSRELGKAGSETLAIVLYRGPATRAHIEHIRGLNCAHILRNLLIRGLIERVPDAQNPRMQVYQPTAELLHNLGVTTVEELPDYASIHAELVSFEANDEAHVFTKGENE
jgi:segregation and condensation protein B